MKSYTVVTEWPYNSGEIAVHHVCAPDAQGAREAGCKATVAFSLESRDPETGLTTHDPDDYWEDVFVCAIFAGHLDDLSVEVRHE